MEDCLHKLAWENSENFVHHRLTAQPQDMVSSLAEAFLKGHSGSGASAHGPLSALKGGDIEAALWKAFSHCLAFFRILHP